MPSNKETILITGGTRGLGLATASAFAKSGKKLILTYRSDEKNAEQVKAHFKKSGTDCETIAIDLAEEGSSQVLAESVGKITKNISVYVHNAAATAFKPLLDIKPHHIQKTFHLTIGSLIQNVQWIVPMMPSGGSIITVSGLDTKEVTPLHGLLASAKAALETLTSYYAHELAEKKIRVNGVNPGFLATDSTRKYLGPIFDKAWTMASKISPTKEGARLEDVAAVIEFLASEKSRWVVGQTIIVDGGYLAASPFSFLLGSVSS